MRDLISREEYSRLYNLLNYHKETGEYWWTYGQITPRLEWLETLIYTKVNIEINRKEHSFKNYN